MPKGIYKRPYSECITCGDTHYAKGLCYSHYSKAFYTKYKRDRMRKLRKKDPEKYKSISAMHRKRFGGIREQVIQRDGERCVECGMSRQEHRDRFGRDITVDHYDGQGRNSDNPNHDIKNLQTLCLPCHGRKDATRKEAI